MAEVILVGMLMGLSLAIAIGPAFFTLLALSLTKGRKFGFNFALGVALSDLFILIIVLLLADVIKPFLENEWWLLVAASFMFTFSIAGFFKKPSGTKEVNIKGSELVSGFLLNSINPTAYLLWMGFFVLCPQKDYLLIYLLTILLVNFGVDVLKVNLAALLKSKVQSINLKYTQQIIPLTFLVSGGILLYKFIN